MTAQAVNHQATNARSSGVHIDPRRLRTLMERRNGPGLLYTGAWLAMLVSTGWPIHLAGDTLWIWPAMFVYGTVLTVTGYALSHECAHGTFFKTPWLNTLLYWISSLVYLEEPNHRFIAHMRHHNFTWINDIDAQMPKNLPLTLGNWFMEVSGLELLRYEAKLLFLNATGVHGDEVRSYVPARDLAKIKWGARLFVIIYTTIAATALAFGGGVVLLVYFVVPRLLGGIAMQAFVITQHHEMPEGLPDIRQTTRSFSTNWLMRLLYLNMNHHAEHHLYPKVPFHALASLRAELGNQLPAMERGLIRINAKVLCAAIGRTSVRKKEIPQGVQSEG